MRPLTAVPLLFALALPTSADDAITAAVLACEALGELSRSMVDFRYSGIPRELVEGHIAKADPNIHAPLTADLVWRAYRLPDTESPIARARFRNATAAGVVSECLPRLSAAITESRRAP